MNTTVYDTASEAINALIKRGYTSDLYLDHDKDKIVCKDTFRELSPNEFGLDEIYRFEGNTDPGDEMIVYAVSSKDGKLKGIVVNAYGIYHSYRSQKLVEHLSNTQ